MENRYVAKEHRICALCKHLQSVGSGREFPAIADSEYMEFRCAIFGWSTREDYLMDSDPARSFAKQEPFDCERWESCQSSQVQSPAEGGGFA